MELRYEHQHLGPKTGCTWQTVEAQYLCRGRKGREEAPQQSPAWQASGFLASRQAQLGHCGTGTANIWGLSQMRTAHSAHIGLIRAMFSALLAARHSWVPSPGSEEVTAFQRQGQGRTGPYGASRIWGSPLWGG